jgi:nucleotide-binding universal stress UspA family protein
MDTVIVALDGTTSERALPAARELAEQFLARIVVVHVVNQLVGGARGGRFPTRADEHERRARLQELVAELRGDGFDADLEVYTTTLGHPASIIADTARRHRASAIVLATRGHAPVIGVLASSVTQRLLHQAPCPVLVVTPRTTRETFRAINQQARAAAA